MKTKTAGGSGPEGFLSRLKESASSGKAVAVVPRVYAEFSAKALLGNYRAIREIVPHQAMIPMIKAGAYGHGGSWAARILAEMEGIYGFGVATLEEGAEIRRALGARGRGHKVIVFSGTTPWTDEKGWFCEQHGLTAVIGSETDWQQFYRGGWTEKIPYELKFNTGMNRLGIPVAAAASIARVMKSKRSESHPTGVFSHLAMADQPEARLSISQRERFIALRGELGRVFPGAQFHLAGSAGIWKNQLWGLKDLTDIVRPGLALYGIAPWESAPERGIHPVMTLRACVVAIHKLKRGESVGYGGTFTVSGTDEVNVAVLSAGYADGLPRALSNQGHAWVNGQPTRFLGTVSMDLCTVGCSAQTQVGDWVELIGPNVDLWAQARASGTIPYELLTSVTSRVQRIYG